MKLRALSVKDRQIWLLIIVFILLYSLWSLKRHWHFQTDAVDLGIFDQAVWHYSRFEAPLSSVKFSNGYLANLLGDHFHPILAPLGLLYWLWRDVAWLLIAQAVAVGVAAWPLYQLALDRFKHRLFALALAFAYLSFVGVQTLIDYDFHEIALALPLLSFAFLALQRRQFKKYFILIVVSFLVKEDVPLYLAMLGLYAVIRLRLYKVGLATMVMSLAVYFSLTLWVIPYFKGEPFAYEHLPPEIGKTSFDLVKTSLTNPFLVAKAAFYDDHLIKIRTSLNLLLGFGFLPLLDPISLLLTLPNIAERFLTTLIQRWIIRFQYSAILGPVFALATINGISNLFWLLKRLKLETKLGRYLLPLAALLLLVAPLVTTWRNNGPLERIVNPASYALPETLKANYEVLKKIPPVVSVGAQSSWVPHLSQRGEIYSLRPDTLDYVQPEYLVLTNLETTDTFYKYEALEEMKEIIKKRADYEVLIDDGVRLLARKVGQ